MAKKKQEEVEAPLNAAPEVRKPGRPRGTGASGLSLKVTPRITAIVNGLAKRYGKKQAEILATLGAALEGPLVDALRGLQADYEAAISSEIAGLFDAPAEPVTEVAPTDELLPEPVNGDELGE